MEVVLRLALNRRMSEDQKAKERVSIIHKKMEMGKTRVFVTHEEQGLIAVGVHIECVG